MKEKIYEFTLEHSLNAARKKALNQFLKKNASKLKWASSHAWDNENDHLLHISIGPVKWEIGFTAHRVTVFGSGPFWAKMLFTEKKRAQLREGILFVLQETGFLKTKAPTKKAKAG